MTALAAENVIVTAATWRSETVAAARKRLAREGTRILARIGFRGCGDSLTWTQEREDALPQPEPLLLLLPLGQLALVV
jgi:hypothetical protein